MESENFQWELYSAHKKRREIQENAERELDEEIANRKANRMRKYIVELVAVGFIAVLAGILAYKNIRYKRINSDRQLKQELADQQKLRDDEALARLEDQASNRQYEAHTNGLGSIDCTISQ